MTLLRDAAQLLAEGQRSVLVTVVRVRGSAPRELGARMLVTAEDTRGSIGGGQLEFRAVEIASRYLGADTGPSVDVRRFPLGAECGQCCGGVVDLMFERVSAAADRFREIERVVSQALPAVLLTERRSTGLIDRRLLAERDNSSLAEYAKAAVAATFDDGLPRRLDGDGGRFVLIEPIVERKPDVVVFGAGHVGSALVAILSMLAVNLRWVDSRPGFLPQRVATGVQTVMSEAPESVVASMPPATCYVVMTHSHALDYAICRAVLARADFCYLGLIGSGTKRRRFETRLSAEGIDTERLTCPIGLAGMSGKKPADVALAVAAEVKLKLDHEANAPVQRIRVSGPTGR